MVERYADSHNASGLGFSNGITPDPGGDYVRHADYAALEAKLAERVKVDELRNHLTLLHSLANDTTQSNWADNRLYVLQTCVRMSDALSALEATPPAQVTEGASAKREVLLFSSYCGDDNTACSEVRPCPSCLGMSNVVNIPAVTPIEHAREFEPRWLSNKRMEALTARQIGKAPKRTLTAAQEQKA